MGRVIAVERPFENLQVYSGLYNVYTISIHSVRAVTYDEKNGCMSIKTEAETIVLHSGQGNWTRGELTESFVDIKEYAVERFGENKVICTEGGKLYTLVILK